MLMETPMPPGSCAHPVPHAQKADGRRLSSTAISWSLDCVEARKWSTQQPWVTRFMIGLKRGTDASTENHDRLRDTREALYLTHWEAA